MTVYFKLLITKAITQKVGIQSAVINTRRQG